MSIKCSRYGCNHVIGSLNQRNCQKCPHNTSQSNSPGLASDSSSFSTQSYDPPAPPPAASDFSSGGGGDYSGGGASGDY
jgi:uncharacterized membrane protein YgcG